MKIDDELLEELDGRIENLSMRLRKDGLSDMNIIQLLSKKSECQEILISCLYRIIKPEDE